MRKVPIEIEKKIIEAYWTKTAKELSEMYGFKPNTIKGIWQRNGLSGKNKFAPDEKEFIDIYTSHTIKDTAKYFNVDRHTIVQFAKKINIYDFELKITPEQKEEIIAKYNTNTSKELAKEYNISPSWVSGIWKQAGLKGKTNRTYYLDETFFDTIDSDEKAYWVGFIAADGCIYHPTDNRQDILSITLQNEDKEHLEKFKQALKTQKPLSYHQRCDRQYVSLQISSNHLVQSLKNIGIDYRKTYDVKWPRLPEEFIPSYIRGYFDGDGSISKNIQINKMHRVNIGIVGFEENLQNFQKYLSQKNIRSLIVLDKRENKYTKQNFANLSFTNKKEKNKFLHLIYDNATVYLDRKYTLAEQFMTFFEQNPKTWTIKNSTPSK